ncbi:MAG: MFS transporter [Acidobacteria bacterium]|nr:MFS transporter [Acidobacteriota bacterium]
MKEDTAASGKRSWGPGLPRTVLALGAVSLLTDMSSEMIYPLLPLFLSGVLGAGAVALGLMEGVAESTAALLKLGSGIWADRMRRRKPLILTGYGLAGIVRPLIGLATVWPAVLLLRFLDRIGKGLRSSPRDALIADATPVEIRGKAYGFHRAMDHAGAVIGPLAAAGLLSIRGITLRHVFLLAALPAALVMAVLVVAVRETAPRASRSSAGLRLRQHWHALGPAYHYLLLAVLIFTLGNSSDTFLLLNLSQAGVPAVWVAALWSAHHVVKMLATWFFGSLSDRQGCRRLIAAGWILYAAVYLGFGIAGSIAWMVPVFLVYGVHFGLTEPAEKAWISRLVPENLRGTAFGLYHGAIGMGALPASLLFGWLWQVMGPATAFTTGAALALVAAAILSRVD